MNLDDIRFIFNRALSLTFERKKSLFVFCNLILCGLLIVFFRGLAMEAGSWIVMSLTFLPIFISSAVLLSAGVILVRVYHDEIKKFEISYRQIFNESWELVIGISYFSIPLILCYLLLWFALGLFVFLNKMPVVGDFFGVILSFAPFLLNFGSLLLCFFSLALLFFVTPIMGLRGLNRTYISKVIMQRLKGDIFSNLFLAVFAALPIILLVCLLVVSFWLTESVITIPEQPLHLILQWLFVMVPFSAILTPAVIFFFNFATESHVLLVKKGREA